MSKIKEKANETIKNGNKINEIASDYVRIAAGNNLTVEEFLKTLKCAEYIAVNKTYISMPNLALSNADNSPIAKQ